MQKMECPCGYIYDPAEGDADNNINPGTAFADPQYPGGRQIFSQFLAEPRTYGVTLRGKF